MRPRATDHAHDCEWHLDQYDFECTCGAVEHPEKFKPQWLKAPDGQRPNHDEEGTR